MKCRKLGCDQLHQYELHHIIPKSIGGTDKDGRVYLCKKHHDIIHKVLPSVIFKFVIDKEKCYNDIKNFTEKFLKEVTKYGVTNTIQQSKL